MRNRKARLEIQAATLREKDRLAEVTEQKRLDNEAEQRRVEAAMEKDKRESELRHELELRKVELETAKLKLDADVARQGIDAGNISHGIGSLGGGMNVKIPRLPTYHDGKDSLDSYLERYERFAITSNWPEQSWAINLSALLTGRALDVYTRLSADQAKDYEQLKKALLERYQLNAEGFRCKLRESTAEEGENPAQFLTRLDSYLQRWTELSETDKTYEGLRDLILSEQFLATCSPELRTFLKERPCTSIKELGVSASRYLEAHSRQLKDMSRKANVSRVQTLPQTKVTCSYCHRLGHSIRECRTKKQNEISQSREYRKPGEEKRNSVANVGTERARVRCFKCDSTGHIARDCPRLIRSERVACVRDSQCTGKKAETVGCVEVAKEEGCKRCEYAAAGKVVSQVAEVANESVMPFCQGKIGTQVVKALRDSGCSCVIVKRKFVKDGQLTGEIRSVKQLLGTTERVPVARVTVDTPYLVGDVDALCVNESLYDLVIGNVPGAREPFRPNSEWEMAGAMQTRAQSKKPKQIQPLKVKESDVMEISVEEMSKLQRQDESLKRLWDKKEVKTVGESKSWFWVENDILRRSFSNPKVNCGNPVQQVVVPSGLRNKVMALAHDSILGGHLGTKRTVDKVLSNFFWPGVGSDVKRYCRSCGICQRTIPKGKVKKAPLEKLPVIDIPFRRVSFDLVGPIYPASHRGYKYILTAVDHASRYPEAVPLKNIDTETVAEAMFDMFSRVGFPQEILHDLGTQFVSEVMKEVSRLLSMKQLTSTPYHPICNGLVERFNGTLKQMLKRLCAEEPQDWDRYVSALLFAYREVPQESTGFSPFELLYGRTVRGPMQILKAMWTQEKSQPEVRNSYQYVFELRGRLEKTLQLAHQNLRQAQKKHKHHYDKRARPRELNVGSEVLVLLPTHNNKLLMQWKGPYKVLEKTGVNDYRVSVKGKVRTYHVNLLKEYVVRKEEEMKGKPVMELAGSGVIESEEGEIGLQSDNVKKIQEAPRPKTKTQVKSFLGLTGYCRNFIPNYANIAMPLTDLTKKGRPNKIVWDKPQEDSFQNLKRQLAKRPRQKLLNVDRLSVYNLLVG